LVKRQRGNSKNRRVRLKTPETQTSKGRSGVHLLGSLSLPPLSSLLAPSSKHHTGLTCQRMWVLCFFAAYFFIVGDAIKNPKEQKIAEENNGKETQKQPHS